MAFQVSPGVTINETDLTTTIPPISVSGCGYVGIFQWGPAEQRTVVNSENELKQIFGVPKNNPEYGVSWLLASNYLTYSGGLQVVRHTESTDYNSVSNGSPMLIKNRSHFEALDASGSVEGSYFFGKYPGELGNSIQVVVVDGNGSLTDTTNEGEYADYIALSDGVPGTSPFAEDFNVNAKDEIHVFVIDADGKWSGTKGTVLERYQFVSKAKNAKNADGTSNYYRTVINNQSIYIWVGEVLDTVGADQWGRDISLSDTTAFSQLSTGVYKSTLSGGANYDYSASVNDYLYGSGYSAKMLASYQEHFADAESSNISLLIAGAVNATTAGSLITLAENRQDCIVFCSPKLDPTLSESSHLTACTTYRTGLGSSSYGVMDSGMKYQYDRYNDVFRYVPLCSDIAGCCARTDYVADSWFSPAGYDRGRINNITKLVYNPSKKTHRDELHTNQINAVITFDGIGTVLFDDTTLQSRQSTFSFINVRRLFIVLEKIIKNAAKYQLFNLNDTVTRTTFVQMIDPFLRDIQGRRGLQSFQVICNEQNNPPSIVNAGNFVADIYIQPITSIRFIRLNFINTPTGYTFRETGV
jgi:hypothetical protein